jgi:hypothetical protein
MVYDRDDVYDTSVPVVLLSGVITPDMSAI